MHRNGAVVGGAFGEAAAAAAARRESCQLLGVVRLLEDADAVQVVVLTPDDCWTRSRSMSRPRLVQREELLIIPRRQISRQGHRLDAFARRIEKLAASVAGEARLLLALSKAVSEATKKGV